MWNSRQQIGGLPSSHWLDLDLLSFHHGDCFVCFQTMLWARAKAQRNSLLGDKPETVGLPSGPDSVPLPILSLAEPSPNKSGQRPQEMALQNPPPFPFSFRAVVTILGRLIDKLDLWRPLLIDLEAPLLWRLQGGGHAQQQSDAYFLWGFSGPLQMHC